MLDHACFIVLMYIYAAISRTTWLGALTLRSTMQDAHLQDSPCPLDNSMVTGMLRSDSVDHSIKIVSHIHQNSALQRAFV